MKKKFLVTGCCGFIGSNLCDFLINKNYDVIGVDNLLTGRKQNIEKLLKKSNFNFIEHDVCEPLKLKSNIDKVFSLCIHCQP